MISLEEVRQTVINAFQTAHAISYSGTLVNFPNYVVVDLENQKNPFVSVDLSIDKSERLAIGEVDIFVQGTLRAYYYFREGKGLSNAYTYTDMLNNELCLREVDSVNYHAVDTSNVISFPGWQGVMNSVKFDIVMSGSC